VLAAAAAEVAAETVLLVAVAAEAPALNRRGTSWSGPAACRWARTARRQRVAVPFDMCTQHNQRRECLKMCIFLYLAWYLHPISTIFLLYISPLFGRALSREQVSSSHPLLQGGVSKAFSSPKPMFIQTGVSLNVSAATTAASLRPFFWILLAMFGPFNDGVIFFPVQVSNLAPSVTEQDLESAFKK
jgi:hypothetical protein